MQKTLVLAHYYTSPQVQQLADFVGDSLDLSIRARESKAERIVFAGVKFMAETAKIINPQSEVILPDQNSTCSLVTQSLTRKFAGDFNLIDAIHHIRAHKAVTVVTYINSSVKLKALSDVIVTSANVEDIVSDLINRGHEVFFTPDRNMGAYLASQNLSWGRRFDYFTGAVCEVHDQFASNKLTQELATWSNFGKYVLAHPESPLPVLKQANFVGSTKKMLQWVKDFKYKNGTIYVATEEGLIYNMREARPELDIRLAPTYSGCQCNACPYMQKNTVDAVQAAVKGTSGYVIDYIDETTRLQAIKPIERMLNWRK